MDLCSKTSIVKNITRNCVKIFYKKSFFAIRAVLVHLHQNLQITLPIFQSFIKNLQPKKSYKTQFSKTTKPNKKLVHACFLCVVVFASNVIPNIFFNFAIFYKNSSKKQCKKCMTKTHFECFKISKLFVLSRCNAPILTTWPSLTNMFQNRALELTYHMKCAHEWSFQIDIDHAMQPLSKFACVIRTYIIYSKATIVF